MPIIDSQVHAYERDRPERPWHAVLSGPPEATGDQMVAAMDAVGVDGAILVSVFTMYRYDDSYARQVRLQHPGRFALVKPVDPTNPAVGEVVEEWAGLDGTVGIRLVLSLDPTVTLDHPGLATAIQAAIRHNLPINVLSWENVGDAAALADRFPEARFVLDHMGIKQPHQPPAAPEPWKTLPQVLELAKRDNVVIRVSGACTLSHAGYPYPDIWEPLARIFDAYGLERCLWGTDWTRASNCLNYEQGTEPFRVTDRLSESERVMLMGGACAKTYGWEPTQ